MTTVRQRLTWAMMVGLAGALLAAGCSTTPPEEQAPPKEVAGPHDALLKLFPASEAVAGWHTEGPVKVYGPPFNAAAAVEPIQADLPNAYAPFLEFGYRKSGTCRYLSAQGDAATLRIFVMDSPSEAFGIFSVQAKGSMALSPGRVARVAPGVLQFVKGDCYVWLTYTGAPAGETILLDLGTRVATAIASEGYSPSIFMSFPKSAKQGEQYYFHTFETWSSLPFVPVADRAVVKRLLNLGPSTDVAIVGYPTDVSEKTNYLFAIRYGTRGDAEAAADGYTKYLDESLDPAEQNTAVAVRGQYLIGTFNAEANSLDDRLRDLSSELAP